MTVSWIEIADFCLRNLKIADTVMINGKLEENAIEIIDIEKYG